MDAQCRMFAVKDVNLAAADASAREGYCNEIKVRGRQPRPMLFCPPPTAPLTTNLSF